MAQQMFEYKAPDTVIGSLAKAGQFKAKADTVGKENRQVDYQGFLSAGERLANAFKTAEDKMQKSKDLADASRARHDFKAQRENPDYLAKSDTDKNAYWQNIYESNLENESEAYINAHLTLSMGDTNAVAKGAEVERQNRIYNNAYMDSVYAWIDKGISTEEYIETTAVDQRVDKVGLTHAIITGVGQDAESIVKNSVDYKDYLENINNAGELLGQYKTPRFLDNKSKRTAPVAANAMTSYAKAKKETLSRLQMEASNREQFARNNGFQPTAEELDADFKLRAIDSTTGQIDEAKYSLMSATYKTDKFDYDVFQDYTANMDMTQQLTETQRNNKYIKKAHNFRVADALINAIAQGNDTLFNSIAQAQAANLKEAKATYLNTLYNLEGDPIKRETAWSNVTEMLQSPDSSLAFKAIFGDEYKNIVGISNVKRYLGKTTEEALEMVSKTTGSPDEIKIRDKDIIKSMAKYGVDYGPLNDEFRSIIQVSMGAGVDVDTLVDATSELFDQRVGKLGDTVMFSVTGLPPQPLPQAQDIYDNIVNTTMEPYVKLNKGNPVFLEVLNDGKAIVKDATFGYRLPGYIDLPSLKNMADIYHLNRADETIGLSEDIVTDVLTMGGTFQDVTDTIRPYFKRQFMNTVSTMFGEDLEWETFQSKESKQHIGTEVMAPVAKEEVLQGVVQSYVDATMKDFEEGNTTELSDEAVEELKKEAARFYMIDPEEHMKGSGYKIKTEDGRIINLLKE